MTLIKNSFFINPTTYSEIDKELSTFKNKKANIDNFKIDLLKTFKQFLIPGLVIVLNLSFNEGVEPDLLKIAKVIPAYKIMNAIYSITIGLFPF